ncbi:MAG: N-6 DNA methylase, partial [Candidatus Calescibacterium sp.]|nr:N-6 DNA methylase [Candidatus Calescibacterium sp.]
MDRKKARVSSKDLFNIIVSRLYFFGYITDFNYPNINSIIENDKASELFDDVVFRDYLLKGAIKENLSIRNLKEICPKLLTIIRNYYFQFIVSYERRGGVKAAIADKTLGGLFPTPHSLVCEMLDHLPDEVWSNPHLKWFDPCCGSGTFVVEIFYRLLKKLPPPYNNPKHIIENMLYFNDINKNYVRVLCTRISRINKDKEFKYNIYSQDYLNFETNMKFDIIIGNPPFNSGVKRFYNKFVSKSIDLSNRFVLMISPIQLVKAYYPDVVEVYNKMVDNGLCLVKFIGDKAFKDALVDCCYVVVDKNKKSSYEKKFLNSQEKYYKFLSPKEPIIKGDTLSLIFKGYKNGKPYFEEIKGVDVNPHNHADKWRIAVVFVFGGS